VGFCLGGFFGRDAGSEAVVVAGVFCGEAEGASGSGAVVVVVVAGLGLGGFTAVEKVLEEVVGFGLCFFGPVPEPAGVEFSSLSFRFFDFGTVVVVVVALSGGIAGGGREGTGVDSFVSVPPPMASFFFFFGVPAVDGAVGATTAADSVGFVSGGGIAKVIDPDMESSGAGVGAFPIPGLSGLGFLLPPLGASAGASIGLPPLLPPLLFIFCIAARLLFRPDKPRHFSRCEAYLELATLSLSQDVHLK